MIGIGFAVALVGAVFMYIMWRSYSQVNYTRTWAKTPAVMIVSNMNIRSAEYISKEYSWNVEYTYEFGGEEYTSRFHTPRSAKWTSRKKQIQDEIDARPMNASVFCYVNPASPSQAILEHDSKAAGYSIWFPGLFVIGGVGIMWGAVRGMKPC